MDSSETMLVPKILRTFNSAREQLILNNFVLIFCYLKNSLYLCRRNRVRTLSALAQKRKYKTEYNQGQEFH